MSCSVRSFDALGQQFVVIDQSADRIDALDLVAYHADIPGLAGDAATRTTSPSPGWIIPTAPGCSR